MSLVFPTNLIAFQPKGEIAAIEHSIICRPSTVFGPGGQLWTIIGDRREENTNGTLFGESMM